MIAVIGILAALAIPVLSRSSARAQETISLKNIRECLILIQSAPGDAGRFPVAKLGGLLYDPSGPTAYATLPNGDTRYFPWFGQSTSWNWVLMAAGIPASHAWVSPSRRIERFGLLDADYVLTHTALAAREHWVRWGSQRTEMWGGQLFSSIRRPAKKVILYELGQALLGRNHGGVSIETPRPLCFADGHVEVRAVSEGRPGVRNRFTGDEGPVLTTEEGLSGWDY